MVPRPLSEPLAARVCDVTLRRSIGSRQVGVYLEMSHFRGILIYLKLRVCHMRLPIKGKGDSRY